jgi:adenylate kinase family enzyme
LKLANAARRVAVVGVSGNGKTTFSRELASRLEVPYVELDALFHLPGWREADLEDFRRSVEQAMSSHGWVLDGSYPRILGPLILERADTVVWLDQPLPLVLLRLVRRAIRDIVTQRDLFNGNRQTWRYAFFMRDSLVSYAVKAHFRRRRIWPELFAQQANLRVVRLRSPRAVAGWLETQGAAA